MAIKVILPKQGLQMTEGIITRWLFAEGDNVTAEEPLFEMETDKLNMEIAAPASGILLKILKKEDETVPVGETIAFIGEKGEKISGILPEINPAQRSENIAAEMPEKTAVKVTRDEGKKFFITPRAKTLAANKGLIPEEITGTGPDGMVIERDVLKYAPVQNVKVVYFSSHKVNADMTEIIKIIDKSKKCGREVLPMTLLVKSVSRALRDMTDIKPELSEVEPGSYINADKTFYLSDMGAYDMDESVAGLVPPAIFALCAGKIERTPVAKDDAVIVRPIMALVLSYDNKIIDSVRAAMLLQKIRQYLQDPYLMI
jgi:pyruvate/2-oxoglutarate dehydrogenase complex dihydrolipoamide acyltransferase (E2) component